MAPRIAVLGAGNGGQALAGHLSLKGCEVALYEHSEFKQSIKEVLDTQRIRLDGEIEGEAALSVTTDASSALEGAEIVFVVVPAFAQEAMWNLMGKANSTKLIIFVPDNYASVKFSSQRQKKVGSPILAGTSTLPYACRAQQGVVKVSGTKRTVLISATRSQDNEELKTALGHLPLDFTIARSAVEVNLSNLNMIVHCATALMNAGKIERAEKFRFYWDGITPSIARVLEALDGERVEVEEKLGLKPRSAEDLLELYYGIRKSNLFEALTTAKVYGSLGYDAPRSLAHRYFTEDIPYGLVPLSRIGKSLDVKTPVCDAIILLASVLNHADYQAVGNDRILDFLSQGRINV